MGLGLANKRLAQPLSKLEAMLRSFSRWWKKTSQSWKKNNHRVKKQISTKFAIWVQKCKFHECTSFSMMQKFGKFSKQCLLKNICWLVLISYYTWCNYTLQLWHHIKLFSHREYVFQVVDQSCIQYSKFVAITAFAFWHWPGCKCSANLIFHPVNVSIILGLQSPTRSRKTPTVRECKPEIEGVVRSNVEFSLYSWFSWTYTVWML